MLGRRFNKKEPFILISKPIKDNSGFRVICDKGGHYSVNKMRFKG